jgi:hypothetical protein
VRPTSSGWSDAARICAAKSMSAAAPIAASRTPAGRVSFGEVIASMLPASVRITRGSAWPMM